MRKRGKTLFRPSSRLTKRGARGKLSGARTKTGTQVDRNPEGKLEKKGVSIQWFLRVTNRRTGRDKGNSCLHLRVEIKGRGREKGLIKR